MKNNFLLITILLFLVSGMQLSAQNSIVGKWKTIDDATDETKSVVEIYEKKGEYFGRIVKLFPSASDDPDPICDKCPTEDDRYNKKVIGMVILKNMRKDSDEYTGGTVLKPDEGKIYKCKIWIEGENLFIRGYWGFMYRTQTWLKYN